MKGFKSGFFAILRGGDNDAEGAAVALNATQCNQALVKSGKVWQLNFKHFEKEQVHDGPYSHFA
jgi:hypothetical protein